MKATKIRVYFDGACHLCSREIRHYQNIDSERAFEFVDIAAPEFKAENEGLSAQALQKAMHVRDLEGNLHKGVDAFILMWGVLPGWSKMARIAKIPGINHFLHAGYFVFARLRPYLPKRKRDTCDTGACER